MSPQRPQSSTVSTPNFSSLPYRPVGPLLEKKITLLTPHKHSLPTPRRRNLRLHRRVPLQQHADLQPADQGPRRRPFGGGSRGRESQRSVPAGNTGKHCAVLHGRLESRVLDGGRSGGLRVVGQLVCALGQYQGEGHNGGSVMKRRMTRMIKVSKIAEDSFFFGS